VFHSNRNTGVYDLYQKSSSGAGNDELVFQSSDRKYPQDLSRDGRFVVYSTFGTGQAANADLWVLPLSGERKPFVFLKTEFHETQAQFSPDGRWMAYVSNESGRDEVYISGFPMVGSKVQVSTSGGRQPRWRRDGKELFYLSPDRKFTAVPINTEPTLGVGTPRVLFGVPFTPGGTGVPASRHQYDVAADGERFLLTVPPENSAVPITVVLNWTAGIRSSDK
jgi:dipeptidyl aminopeptidase/acylaminoacyl peptidase